jgi:hypothetical protein
MIEIVRVLRVLEYEGPRDWVESSLKDRAVKGERRVSNRAVIREAILGETPEVIAIVEDNPRDCALAREKERKRGDKPPHSIPDRSQFRSNCEARHDAGDEPAVPKVVVRDGVARIKPEPDKLPRIQGYWWLEASGIKRVHASDCPALSKLTQCNCEARHG